MRMKSKHASKAAHFIACTLASCALSATAIAAPYAISYTGTISGSSFTEINDGQPYTVTLVVDNGGSTAQSQTWDSSSLQCVIWSMNTAGNVQYAQDLTAASSLSTSGSITTDGTGALSTNFSSVVDSGVTPGSYTTSGFTPVDPILWFLNDANNIFYDNDQSGSSFGDLANGVQMAVGNWTSPQPFAGSCSASVAPPPPPPTSIPTLSEWGMILLSSLLALGTIFTLRRKRQ